MKLKPDMWVKRKFSPKIKEAPTRPLTDDEKKGLAERCWDKCFRAYKNRMIHSGLLSDFESADDLVSEAYIAMLEILNRFDLSKCGKVAEFDVPGDKNPKTLDFYFLNYFYGRVNFMACESRSHKKSRNVQGYSGEIYGELEYDPLDLNALNNTGGHNYEITGHILNQLKETPRQLQRFFYQTYILQCSYKELVDEYGQEKCRQRKIELQEFLNSVQQKFKNDFIPPEKKERKRKKRRLAALASTTEIR